jgi:hypothetical protein
MNKSTLKHVGIVAAGVMLAGFVMAQFSDVGVVAQARHGFGGR